MTLEEFIQGYIIAEKRDGGDTATGAPHQPYASSSRKGYLAQHPLFDQVLIIWDRLTSCMSRLLSP